MEVKNITKEQAWKIRKDVLWKEKDIDFVKIDNDDEGAHLGLFDKGEVVSVISLFFNNNDVQFRKFATIEEKQNKGFGTKLLSDALLLANDLKVDKVWCNVRKDKLNFYKKFGFVETTNVFQKENIEYVIMEKMIM